MPVYVAGLERGVRRMETVDANDLVDQFGSGDGFVRARLFARAIELLG